MENEQNNTTNNSTELTPTPVNKNKETIDINRDMIMSILCYLGPLVLIPFLMKEDSPNVSFHIKQGLVLFGAEVIFWLLIPFVTMLSFGLLTPLIALVGLGFLVLTLLGIYHVIKQKEVPLPIIGKFTNLLKF